MYDGYMTFNGVELFNVSRTATLAETLGIDAVWVTSGSVNWVRQKLGETNYHVMSNAPWYDAGAPETHEFAGILPLGVTGGADSSWSSTPIEFITDGGVPGRSRYATQDLVFSAAIVASTDRGAAYGLRWLNQVLIGDGNQSHHAGYDLYYWRNEGLSAPLVRRLNVKMTRGTSVTRKRKTDCSSVWLVTFTLNSANPREYGILQTRVLSLGPAVGNGAGTGPGIVDNGYLTYGYARPAEPNYNPLTDPANPALIAPPASLDPYPRDWPFTPPGRTMHRYWARVSGMNPTSLPMVPHVTVRSATAVRGVRVSVWPFDTWASVSERDNYSFSASMSYLPAGFYVTLDGRTQQIYSGTRRAESLAYSERGGPVEWGTIKPVHTSGDLVFAIDVVDNGFPAQAALSLASIY